MSPRCQRLLLVCLNDRGEGHPKGSCARAGGDALLDKLRAELSDRGLKGAARAVGTRCLGQCQAAPVVAAMPEDVWYGGVQEGDALELIESHVLGGQPLERLRLGDDDMVGRSREEIDLPRFED